MQFSTHHFQCLERHLRIYSDKHQPIGNTKMKAVFVVIATSVCVTFAVDDRNSQHETTTYIPILKYNKQQSEDGSYKTQYETGNNIVHEESGYLKDFSETNPNGVLVQRGQYSYESPDGQVVNVEYTADENGFHAVGDHIPTPPPIPKEIQTGLDQIYAGIKIQQEESAERARTDPEYAKKLEERSRLNYNGQYYEQ